MALKIETERGDMRITTDRPVSVATDHGETTVTIEGVFAPSTVRFASPRPPKPAASMLPGTDRCGATMARSGAQCARVKGHNGVHMSADQIARKQEYNKKRARDRYQNDPEYRESVKAGSRESHARRKEAEAAT